MPDAHKNFAYSTVATAPSPASSGTSLVVGSGHGVRFPAVPFSATIWPTGTKADPSNAEIVRVTALSSDTFSTIVRTQEGTSARTVVVGDQIAATITAKTLADALFSSADSPPGSPDAFDDEFTNSASLSNWTVYSGASLSVEDIDTTVSGKLYIKRNAGAESRVAGRYKAISTAGTYLISLGASSARENYHRGGCVVILPSGTISDSSPVLECGWIHEDSLNVIINRHSALGTYQDKPFGGGFWGRLSRLYIKIAFASATSVTVSFSTDGLVWIQAVNGYNPGWNMDKIGWGIDTSSGATYPVETTYDYFRKIA